jgi:hypothetical protein
VSVKPRRLSGKEEEKALRLVYQHITKAKPSDEMLGNLMDLAVKTHDREVERREREKERELESAKLSLAKWSIVLSAITSIGSILVAILALMMKKGPQGPC